MGCGTSKNQIHDVNQPVQIKESRRVGSGKKVVDSSSVTSLERGGSATSKVSRHSGDSGFDDEEEQKQREALFHRPLPKMERVEEKKVLETLQEEGLIPIGHGAFGAVSFAVMTEFDGVVRRPPPRLAKLETKKKKKKALTEEEIRDKLEKAELRRKEVEQQRLDKIHSLHRTDVQNPTQDSTNRSDEHVKTKEEIVAENRERKLREKLEKLRAKEAHAELVRQRKLQVLQNSVDNDKEIAQYEAGL